VTTEYEYAHVRSDDAAKWVGRDGWERDDTTVTLRRVRNPVVFAVGDRVKMGSGRGWHGVVTTLSSAYPTSPSLCVLWDNGREQSVNQFMMNLEPEGG
jgi:hypothetical protein